MTARLVARGLTVRLAGAEVIRRVDLELQPGTITGLIGPNGAGKTTLLDALTGLVPVAAGTITVGGVRAEGLAPHRRARLGLARTFQALELFEDLTVAENLLVAGGGRGPVAADDRYPTELSHAARSRLAVDRALAGAPAVLLLDEPAAGLDDDGRAALAVRLRSVAAAGTAVLLVDHDMRLVLDLCNRITVLERGRVLAEGPPQVIRDDLHVIDAYLGRAPSRLGGATLARPAPAGASVLDVRGLTAGYSGVPLVRDVDLTVAPGEVVALLGLNGAGKTTTLLAIAGVLARMAGVVSVLGEPAGRPGRLARRGLACVRQGQAPFPGLTVAEHLRLTRGPTDEALDRLPALRPLLGRDASTLSGGEQRMLAVAMALARRPRLLLVDELSLGLAPIVVDGLLRALRQVADDRGTAILVVEQHPHLALAVADRGYVMERGRILAAGPPAELRARYAAGIDPSRPA